MDAEENNVESTISEPQVLATDPVESRDKTDKLYRENKILYPYKDFSKLRPHKGVESHIFSGEAETKRPGKKILAIKDSVSFGENNLPVNKNIRFHKRRIECSNTDYNTGSRIFPTDKGGNDE